jgi:hypothetical protein
LHFGSTVSAVTRPDHCVPFVNACVPSRSTFSVSGPRKSHFGATSELPRFATAAFAAIAPWIWSIEMPSIGKARAE